MADVARRRTQTADRLGNRAVGHRAGAARHSSSQPQRVNGSRQQATYQSTDPNEIRYSMDILVQPPATAVSGYTLQPGLTVRLRSLSGDLNDAIYDSSNLVAVATLTSSHTPLADADLNTILAGRRYNSIHPFDEDTEVSLGSSDPRGVGYVSFPDLSIRREGTYRIRITLIRIRSSSGEPPMSPASGATTVQVIESNPITVRGNGSTSASAAMQQGKQMVAI
ncbi:hypothetical protein GQ43DRAFT_444608, partial [Delitschia confertaspora ATCC 74209]